jgi:hypothetical protein
MRWLWRLFSVLALALCASVLLALAALWLALDPGPAVATPAAVTPADVGRVYALLQRHRPSRTTPGVVRAAGLAERDLELLLAEAGRRLVADARPRVTLRGGRAVVQLSLLAPPNPWGDWINLRAELAQTDGLPDIDSVRIGRLPVPAPLALWAAKRLLKAYHLETQGALALRSVNRVSFLPGTAVVAFSWPTTNLRQVLADTLLTPDDQQRLRLYAEHLSAWRRRHPAPATGMPLSHALPPVFALVRQRLDQGGPAAGSAAEENRAALLALALTATPEALPKLVPASQAWATLPAVNLTLRGRVDFTQHFLVSAVIAAEGGGPLSDAVGVFKEIADSQGGSGFSFNDITADRAGTRFGLLVQQAPEELHRRLVPGLTDADLLPPVDDLPEFLSAAEFRKRYGGMNSPLYRAMLADIEARLDRLALLTPPTVLR